VKLYVIWKDTMNYTDSQAHHRGISAVISNHLSLKVTHVPLILPGQST